MYLTSALNFTGTNEFPLESSSHVQTDGSYSTEDWLISSELADFGGLRIQAVIDFDCFEAISLGAVCGIGDHMHPRGQRDQAVYERIDRFPSVSRRSNLGHMGRAMTDMAVICDKNDSVSVSPDQKERAIGDATRLLAELKQEAKTTANTR